MTVKRGNIQSIGLWGWFVTDDAASAAPISGSGLGRLLNQRCDIWRYSEGSADGYGHLAKTYAELATSVPCRLREAGGKETWADDKTVVPADYIIYLPRNQDVTERDRIVLDSITYDVLRVQHTRARRREHHLKLFMRAVR